MSSAVLIKTLSTVVSIVLFVDVITIVQSATPFAVTSVGVIQGTDDVSPDGLPYYAFKGIPYARAPMGDLRWKLPQPHQAFESVYEATGFKAACLQDASPQEVTSEDCLFVDVYVPGNITVFYDNASRAVDDWKSSQGGGVPDGDLPTGSAEGNSRPVMIWIHGGAYESGSSQSYAAWKLVTEQNIVVVVMQYRLGVFGFLSTGDDILPGNYGLWDQSLAMKWVKANIGGFGGDAAMITITGESAGASSVSQHTVSPHSSGLFHRVVMMSGTVLAPWSFSADPRPVFDKLSMNAGCGDNHTSPETRLACLMNTPADDIYSAAVTTQGLNFITFAPNIDGIFFPDTVDKLLRDEQYLTSVGFYDYEVLMGMLNNEGTVALSTLMQQSPNSMNTGRVPYSDIDLVLPDLLRLYLRTSSKVGSDTEDVVKNRYFYPMYPSQTSTPVRNVLNMYADSLFLVPAVAYLRFHVSKTGASPNVSSYFYYFDWFPSMTEGTMTSGMSHGQDVAYLFDPASFSLDPKEHNVSRMYGDMIGSFVRTGNPKDGISPSSNVSEWLPYDINTETFLRFSLVPSVEHHLKASTTSFWIDLVPRLHSRWLQQTANQKEYPPTTGHSEKLTYFNLSEGEANGMLIALLVVCAVLLLLSGSLCMALVSARHKNSDRYKMKNTGTEDKD